MGEHFESRLKTKVWEMESPFLLYTEEDVKKVINNINSNITVKSILPIRKMGLATGKWRILTVGPGSFEPVILVHGAEHFFTKVPKKGKKAKVSNEHVKDKKGAKSPSIVPDTKVEEVRKSLTQATLKEKQWVKKAPAKQQAAPTSYKTALLSSSQKGGTETSKDTKGKAPATETGKLGAKAGFTKSGGDDLLSVIGVLQSERTSQATPKRKAGGGSSLSGLSSKENRPKTKSKVEKMDTDSSGGDTEEMSDGEEEEEDVPVPTQDEMKEMVFPPAKCQTCKKDIGFKVERIRRGDKHFCYGCVSCSKCKNDLIPGMIDTDENWLMCKHCKTKVPIVRCTVEWKGVELVIPPP